MYAGLFEPVLEISTRVKEAGKNFGKQKKSPASNCLIFYVKFAGAARKF